MIVCLFSSWRLFLSQFTSFINAIDEYLSHPPSIYQQLIFDAYDPRSLCSLLVDWYTGLSPQSRRADNFKNYLTDGNDLYLSYCKWVPVISSLITCWYCSYKRSTDSGDGIEVTDLRQTYYSVDSLLPGYLYTFTLTAKNNQGAGDPMSFNYRVSSPANQSKLCTIFLLLYHAELKFVSYSLYIVNEWISGIFQSSLIFGTFIVQLHIFWVFR